MYQMDLRNLRTSLVKNKIRFAVIFFTLNLMICLYMIGAVFFDTQFLMKRYTKSLGVTKALHMSSEELLMATDTTINLIKGRSQDYEFKALVKGLEDTFLSPKEIRHIKELASAYQVGRGIFFCMGALIVALLLWIVIDYVLWKRKNNENTFCGKAGLKQIAKGFIIAQSFFLTILIILALYFASDPNRAINIAHKLVFKGDNWIMNPVNNRLIYLCPQELIEECVFILCKTMGIYIGIGLLVSVTYLVSTRFFKRNK